MKRIAVYGGSFDPVHEGHLSILRHLCESGEFDEVRMVVSPLSPLKDSSRDDPQIKLRNARNIIASHPELDVIVDDIEFHLGIPYYTITTLDTIKSSNPSAAITMVIGADNLSDIHRWKDYGRILSEYGVLVFPRQGFDAEALKSDLLCENPAYLIRIADAPLVNISSTWIRAHS